MCAIFDLNVPESMKSISKCYGAYEQSFVSDFHLPEFCECSRSSSPIEIIDTGLKPTISREFSIQRIRDGLSVSFKNIGIYNVLRGNEIRISATQQARIHQTMIRTPLFGVVLAVLLNQRQKFVLHGCAISMNGGGATVLLAPKGCGKSTLTARLLERGHKLMADDVTALEEDEGVFYVLPGLPILKLWPDSLRTLKLPMGRAKELSPFFEKQLYEVRECFCNVRRPLQRIIVLSYTDEVVASTSDLKGQMLAVLANHYFASFGHIFTKSEHQELLEMCSKIALKVKVVSLGIPWGLEGIDKSCEWIESLV